MSCNDIPVPPWFYYVEQDLVTALREANEQYVRQEEERFKAGPTAIYNVLGNTNRKRKRKGQQPSAPRLQRADKQEQPKIKKPPLSAYQVFMSIRSAEVRANNENGNISAADIRKAVNAQWNGMVSRQRAPYEAEYWKQKEAFEEENPDWKEQAAAAKAKDKEGEDIEIDLGKSQFEEAYREAKRRKKEERQQRLPPRIRQKKDKENVFGPRPEERPLPSDSSLLNTSSDIDTHLRGSLRKPSNSSKQGFRKTEVDDVNPIPVKLAPTFLEPAKVYPVTAPPSKEQKFWQAPTSRPKQAFPARTYSKKQIGAFAPRVSKAKLECSACKSAGLTGPWLHHSESTCPTKKARLPDEIQLPTKPPVPSKPAEATISSSMPLIPSTSKSSSTDKEIPLLSSGVPLIVEKAEKSAKTELTSAPATKDYFRTDNNVTGSTTPANTVSRRSSSAGARVSLGSSDDPIDLDLMDDEDDSDVEMVIATFLVNKSANAKVQVKQEEKPSTPYTQTRESLSKSSSQCTDVQAATKGNEASKSATGKKEPRLPEKPALKPPSTLVPVFIVPVKTKSIKGRSNTSLNPASTDFKLPSFRRQSISSTRQAPLLQQSLDNLNMAKEGFISAKSLLKPSRASENLPKASKLESIKPIIDKPVPATTVPIKENKGASALSSIELAQPKSPFLEMFDDIEDFASDFGDGADTLPELSASQSKALDSLLSDSGTDDIFDLFKMDPQQPVSDRNKHDNERSILTARRPSMQQAKKAESVPTHSGDEEMDAVLSFGQFAYM